MLGMLLWKEERKGKRERAVTMGEKSVLHVRFQCAEILRTAKTPEAVVRRRIAAACKRMQKLGVSRLVLPEEFPYGQELERWGMTAVSTVPLRQALAADWVSWQLTERGKNGGRVGVSADRMTGEVVNTVTELALRHRYVLLDVPYGGEELSRRLRREYGVSLLLVAEPERLEEAEVLALFAPRDCHIPKLLCLYDQSAPLPPLVLPPVLEERLPPGTDRGQLLAILREAGVIRPGQIAIGGTNLTKKGTFLADSPS